MKEIRRLLNIMDDLRTKCPWDKKQTTQSLKNLTIEEVYELTEAVETGNFENLKEELGDLLLHIVFYSKIASEKKKFNFMDVVNDLCDKLIYRHPHIYGDLVVKNEEEVKLNWENLKSKKTKKSILSGIPKKLPPILKAQRAQDKSTEKFIGRFKILEEIIRNKKQKISHLDKNELEIIWEESKEIFKSNKKT